jgi:hypothetical protein
MKELLYLIQTSKYNLLRTNKMINIWELTKKGYDQNRSQIDKLQLEIKEYTKLLSTLKKTK